MKKNLYKSFLVWLPFAAVITFICLLGYLLVQQDLRQTANDPQAQIVGDVVTALGAGATPQDIVPPGEVIDIRMSLDPYVIIYNASGTILASSATLDGQTPTVPTGVFAYVAKYGEDRLTWQPAPGVRSAVIVDSIPGSQGGFVLAGRSITEIETREANILHLAECAWLAGLIVMFGIVWGVLVAYEKKKL